MNILRTTFILYILVLLSACSEQELVSYTSDRYQSVLKFNLTNRQSRNTTPEDVIQRLDILLFREGILEKAMLNITSFQEDEQGHSYIVLSSDKEGSRTAYVLANYDYPQIFESLAVGTTTEASMASMHTAIRREMPASPFVMYGISRDIQFSKQSETTLCELTRTVAKLAIRNKATDFELTSARLLRSIPLSTIFPNAPAHETEGTDFAAVEATEGNIDLYSYENSASEADKATAVEITGSLRGKEISYTVNLEKDGKLMPLERNTLYTIHVNDVSSHAWDLSVDVNPWKMGDPIEEAVSGSKPVVEVMIDNSTGLYTEADSTVTVNAAGGQFIVNAKANADCDIILGADWIKLVPQTKAPSSIDNNFNISVTANPDATPRKGFIKVFNKINGQSRTLIVSQQPAEGGKDKYMVLVVAGQSNAVGYDESALDAEDLYTPDRALQLSYRMGPAPNQNLSIIPLSWCADDIDTYKRSRPNNSGEKGLKGIHLPLVKELLKYVPADYKIVVVPVAYTSSRFGTDITNYGQYDKALMRPTVMNGRLRWGANSAYRNTIVDRVKYLLDMDARNKFLGVVWCQGENDIPNPDYQYTEFTRMAEAILNDFQDYGDRSNYGVIDKRSWYNYSSTSLYVDWYQRGGGGVFGGYKVWNPDTFIYAPTNLPTNPQNGGPGMGPLHFGQNAYRTIARMVAERMNENGLLFNNTPVVKGHFTDKTTPDEAARLGGSMADSDLKESLIALFPENRIFGTQPGNATYNNSLPVVQTEGLKDINGNPLNKNALQLTPQNGFKYASLSLSSAPVNWSISFLFKRTGHFEENIQCIVYPDISTQPFIGFKKYSPTAGVAKAAEFVIEPTHQNQKLQAVPGQFFSANKVRTLDEWIHYTITYDESSRETSVYMNGELVQKGKVSTNTAVTFKGLYIGHLDDSMPSAEGKLADFCVWNKTLTASSVKKIFLMSYYGFTKAS